MSDAQVQYLIVGGGVAGGAAAEAIRQADPVGSMMLVGQEINRPYHRQQLNGDYLLGKINHDSLFLNSADWYAGQQIELRTARAASHLDATRQVATLDDGSQIFFDSLLIATGAAPERLRVPGSELPNVYYLHSIADADRLRHAALQSLHAGHHQACVIGGTLQAIELAATLSRLGLQVDLVSPETHICNFIGPAAATIISRALQFHGIKIFAPAHPIRLEGDGRVQRILLDNGQTIATDLVVASIGSMANKQILRTTPIRAETAILVDDHCQTNLPHIFAAGQCAAIFDPRFGKHRQFLDESSAAELGRLAGRNMAGKNESFTAVVPIERNILGLDLLLAGESRLVDHRLVRASGTEKHPSLVEFGLASDNRLTQIISIGKTPDRQILLDLIQRRPVLTGQEEAIKDPAFDLSTFLC